MQDTHVRHNIYNDYLVPTSHRALETLAAAANKAAPEGKTIANNDCNSVLDTSGNNSIAAALAAAHKPPNAIVEYIHSSSNSIMSI